MLHTGSTKESVQVQNLAVPADPSDPLLRQWVKSDANPVLVPPPDDGLTDFRDPTTAWRVQNDTAWRVAIGIKDRDHAGLALVYRTEDFVRYDPQPAVMHVVPGTGMWECVDFYPVAADPTADENGLETSTAPGPGVKHVVKASLDDDKHGYYAIGTYGAATDTWAPDDAENDVGVGLRYDYGKYYASKTFYDPIRRRRVLWGWVGETDNERIWQHCSDDLRLHDHDLGGLIGS
jgi:sucrose-6-phosphate hydrolase SacC (GH32 family)